MIVTASGDLWFQLLGPVQARCDGQLLTLGGPKPRAILAALLHRPNETVDTDRLIALVWGAEADVGRNSVYHYIHNLKVALAPAADRAVLHSLRPNYRLALAEPDRVVDWHRFRALTAEANAARQAGNPHEARALLHHALGLWHGEPLADIGEALGGIRNSMTKRRLSAAEELAELELRHGNPGQAVDLLTDVCDRHPERERAAALLVRALTVTGRRADAMAAYQRTRSHMANNFGVDPHSPLEAAYRALIDDQVPTANRQALRSGLPRREGHFVGRQDELTKLHDVLSGRLPAGEGSEGTVVCAIEGMAGIGKTQLAIRAAHSVADHFLDGPLFIDLHGYSDDTDPLEPASALSQLLQRLDVPVSNIPDNLDDRAMLYRSTIADRAFLLILDNARTTSQVRPLLPAAPGSQVIITSRRQLIALDDSVTIRLDVLDPDEAGDLFIAVAGLTASATDAVVIARIVSRCGRLPLAIRIVAARYRGHAWSTLAELDAQLADEHRRLRLMDDDDRSVIAAFTVSYQSLPEDQQQMFRLLGLVPSPESDVDMYDAAMLAGITVSAAQDLLTRLYDNCLLTQPAPGRYAFHDLVRDYAAEVARKEPDVDWHGALTRLLDHYCHTASLAMSLYAPYEPQRRPPIPPPVGPTPPLADRTQAEAWLDAHQRTLLSAALHAATHGWPRHTTHLSRTLFRYLEERVHYTDTLALYSTALNAARLTGDRTAEAHSLNDLASVHFRYHRDALALDDLERALLIDRDLCDRSGEARTLGNLATVHGHQRNFDEAVDHHQRAVRLFVELGDRAGETRAVINLCNVYWQMGRYDEAISDLQRALAQDTGDRAVRGSALATLANTYWRLERYDEAIEHHDRALALQREIGNGFEAAETLNDLARTLRAAHREQEALTRSEQALELATDSGNQDELGRAHDGIADACEALGQRHRAREHRTLALATLVDSESPEATRIRIRLASLDRTRGDTRADT